MKQFLKLGSLTLVLIAFCVIFASAFSKVENGAYEVNKLTNDADHVKLEVSPNDFDLRLDKTRQLSVVLVGYDESDEEIWREDLDVTYCAWANDHGGSKIATVDDGGLVTPHSVGTAQFTCGYSYFGNFVSELVTVTVFEKPDNTIDIVGVVPGYVQIEEGNQVQLTAYEGTYSFDTMEETITDVVVEYPVWKSGDESIVTVDEKGLVTAVGSGETYVMASYVLGEELISGSCEITVIPPLPSFHLEMEENLTMELGSTYKLSPRVVEGNGLSKKPNNKIVHFKYYCTSHNTVGVDEDGLLTAKKVGKATVTCKAGGLEAKCNVEVVFPKCTVEAPEEITVEVGEKVKLGSTVSPSFGTLTFTSADTSIATVSKYGNVKGIKGGQTVVKSIAPDGTEKETKVKVVYPQYIIETDVISAILYGGDTIQVNAKLTPAKGKLKWTTSDKKVAQVDQNGLITAQRGVNGKATITCTAPDGITESTVDIIVYRANYQLEIEEEMFLIGGEKQRIEKTLTPNHGRCTWTSSNESVATVNMYGTVTAKKGVDGVCTITCTAPDGKTTDTCVVHVTKN